MRKLAERGLRLVRSLLGAAASLMHRSLAFPALLVTLPFLLGASEPIAGSLSPMVRWFLVGMMALIISISISTAPSVGLVAILLYVSLMGALRRSLIPFLGYESNDPITLVTAAIGFGMVIRAFQQGQIRRDTPISKLILPMMGIMAVEVINPLQGGLLVGLSGAIFYLGPICWYLIGRNLGSRKILMTLCKTVIFMAILAGIYGMVQTYNGFLPEEIAWIKQSGYSQVMGSGRYRVFSFYLSFGEYVFYVSMGAILSWVNVLQRRFIYLAPFVFLLMVLFVSSSRGGVVMTLLGVAVVWAVQGPNWRAWLPRLVMAALVGTYGLNLGLQEAREATFSKETSGYIQHQIEGLTDPFSRKSTGGAHVSLVSGGIMAGLRNPIGRGLGITTPAAKKFGGGNNVSTEVDISNMFLTCGLIGGVLYTSVVVMVCLTLARYWQSTRDVVGLSIIGICAVTAGNWLTSGYYSLNVTVWLCLGMIDQLLLLKNRSLEPEVVKPRRVRVRRRLPTADAEPVAG